jgi:hypothetical protein
MIDHALGGGFSVAAGDGDYDRADGHYHAAITSREATQGLHRVIDDERPVPARFHQGQPRKVTDGGDCALLDRLIDIFVCVVIRAANGDEQIPRLDVAGIRRNASHQDVCGARFHPGVHCGRHVAESHGDHVTSS